MELLSYDFVQRGLLAGLLIALSCSLIGVFLILRRLAFLGAGLSHSAFGGIALSFLVGADPFLFTAFFTVLIALLVEYLTKNKKVPGDTAIAVIFSSGMALAVLIVGISKGFGENLFSYLFGNILTVTGEELLFSLFVFILTLLYIFFNYKRLILFSFSEELARVKGLKTDLLSYSFVALTAIVVVASIKAVGVVLASSLVVIPSMTGLILGNSFLGALIFASLAGCLAVLGGIFLSFSYDLPPSGAIVGVSILLFCGAFLSRRLSLK